MIISQYPVAISPGYARQTSAPPREDSQTNNPAQERIPVQAVSNTVASTARPVFRSSALFEDMASYRGQQARNAYQEVALNDEAELLNRLDVRV